MPSIEQLEKLLEADPRDTFVLYGLAQEHAKGGDHETAVSFYRRCLDEDPHYCYAYFHEAKSLEAMGSVGEAIARLKLGVEAARAAGDDKALGEIGSYLDELT